MADNSLLNEYAMQASTLANAVCGFAILQMITFLVSIGTATGFQEKVTLARWWVFGGIIVASALYVAGVWSLNCAQLSLLKLADSDPLLAFLNEVMLGRVIAITLFGLFGAAVVFCLPNRIMELDEK